MILLGFRYLASSIPLIVFAGVGIGVGMIFSFLLNSMARNPLISNSLVRWAFIGFSLVEVSGFIGLVYSFLLLYAFSMIIVLSNHFTFYLGYLGMNYSNVIGFIIFIVFLLQFFSGLLLSCYYSPFNAFYSVYYIMIDVNVGWFIRFIHVLGASLYMVLVIFHWIRGIWIRLKMIEQIEFDLDNRIRLNSIYDFQRGLNLIWVSGWVILISSLITSFLGYILNWGQMSYWGITVIINIISIIPLIGSYIGEYLWCSSLVIVNRVFVVHFVFGFIVGLSVLLHLNILHWFTSSNPFLNNKTSLIIPFYSIFIKDCMISFSVPLFISFYLFCEPDYFGNPDNLIPANPQLTPLHILPEWYFNLFYCVLRACPSKVGGVVIVVFLFILLAAQCQSCNKSASLFIDSYSISRQYSN